VHFTESEQSAYQV